jgi:hypothetical protein
MNLDEYYNRLYNLETSNASVTKKTQAILELEQQFKSQQQKYRDILSDIEQSSPEIPNIFYDIDPVET